MSSGEGAATNFQTARGRDYPTIRQFTVFLENRVGQLLDVVRRFEGTGIRIVALSINDSAECAFVRLLQLVEVSLLQQYIQRFLLE